MQIPTFYVGKWSIRDELLILMMAVLSKIKDYIMEILKNILLKIDGLKVIKGTNSENEIDNLIKAGKLYTTNNLKLYKGGMFPNQCHRNSAILTQKKKSYKLISGYALSNSTWVCHSWLFNGRNIIETTFGRDLYYGYELKGNLLNEFINEN